MRTFKIIAPFVAALLFAMLFWFGLKQDPHRLPSNLIGKKVPEFDLPSLYQPNHILTKHLFDGHVTILNVWASWCYACRAEHPVIVDIANTHLVNIVGIDYKDNRHAAIKWLKHHNNPYNAVISDVMGQLAINLGVYGTPEMFVVDRDGRIRYRYVGMITPGVWNHDILPIVIKLKYRA